MYVYDRIHSTAYINEVEYSEMHIYTEFVLNLDGSKMRELRARPHVPHRYHDIVAAVVVLGGGGRRHAGPSLTVLSRPRE